MAVDERERRMVLRGILRLIHPVGFLLAGWGTPGRPPLTLGMVNMPAFALVVGTTMITTPWGVRLAHAMNASR